MSGIQNKQCSDYMGTLCQADCNKCELEKWRIEMRKRHENKETDR